MATSILYRFSVLALVALLGACGGGGDAGSAAVTSHDPAQYTSTQSVGKTRSLVTITPTESGVITIIAEADIEYRNQTPSESIVDIALGARLIDVEALYFGGDKRLTETVPPGGAVNTNVIATRDLSVIAGRTYVFGFYFVDAALATASPTISNSRITVTQH